MLEITENLMKRVTNAYINYFPSRLLSIPFDYHMIYVHSISLFISTYYVSSRSIGITVLMHNHEALQIPHEKNPNFV
jgi:hypothetical protein